MVAEEIGKLALSSTESSRKIEGLVNDIQVETDITVKTMESNFEKVNTQIASIRKGGEALETIVNTVKENARDVDELHGIYSEIQDMSRLIIEEINKISSIIGDNASCAEELAASALEQNNSVKNINSNTENLNALSKKLEEQIHKFIIN